MISSVCQNLQSYVKPHVLSLLEDDVEDNSTSISIAKIGDGDYSVRRNSGNTENGGTWSLLQALSHSTRIHGNDKEDQVYVHPLANSRLSKKSLEMCTESLGSESGSDMGENDVSLLSVIEGYDSGCRERSASKWVPKKANIRRDCKFPPPLTSISGSTGVRMESHREDGRLVLRAVAVPACGSRYFNAERGHGRLKLQVVKEPGMGPKEEDEINGDEGCTDGDGGYWGNWESDDEEMGMERFGRPCSRCKESRRRESSKELLNWEPVWVST